MSEKKNPARFNIQFDPSIEKHKEVIRILSSKGRNTARYIADAVLAYEGSITDKIESAVINAFNTVLQQGSLMFQKPADEQEDFKFEDIAEVLDGFKQ